MVHLLFFSVTGDISGQRATVYLCVLNTPSSVLSMVTVHSSLNLKDAILGLERWLSVKVKNACCFCTELEFGSQHPHCNSSPKISNALLQPHGHLEVCTHGHTYTLN